MSTRRLERRLMAGNLLFTLLIESLLLRRTWRFGHHHADAVGKRAHRLGKTGSRVLDQKGDCCTVRATPKAVVELLGGAHRERGRFFVVEGAESQQVCPALSQLHISPYDVYDVDPSEEILYEGFRYQSIQARRQLLATDTLVVALYRGSMLALALSGGLFVELARTQLSQETRFFDGAFEAAQRHFKRLIFLKTYDRHEFLGLVG